MRWAIRRSRSSAGIRPPATISTRRDSRPRHRVDGPERAALTIENDGVPMLAIAYDPALRDDPGLVSAAVAAVRLSVENERLQAEVRAQLEAVSASRARLAEAQDTERRRIERDLHDGAQQRLVSLRISLELLRERLGHGCRSSDPRRARCGERRGPGRHRRRARTGTGPPSGDPGRSGSRSGARVARGTLAGGCRGPGRPRWAAASRRRGDGLLRRRRGPDQHGQARSRAAGDRHRPPGRRPAPDRDRR